jgi:hypothetical protein
MMRGIRTKYSLTRAILSPWARPGSRSKQPLQNNDAERNNYDFESLQPS